MSGIIRAFISSFSESGIGGGEEEDHSISRSSSSVQIVTLLPVLAALFGSRNPRHRRIDSHLYPSGRIAALLNGVDSMARSMEKPRPVDDVIDKPKPWQLTKIIDHVQCRLVTMPDITDATSKIGTTQATVSRSLFVPGQNIVIVRSVSFANHKENVQTNIVDGCLGLTLGSCEWMKELT